jgi:Zn-dependent protease/predicted transcriptional regulator
VSPSLSLGRIAGVRIGVHWSWLVVLGLLVWTLSETVFPRQNPGLEQADYRAMAIAAALLLFLSILLHELGHALQARREGMEIDGITLWLFGGVASFRGTFPSPGAEFRIAVAGPVVTLAVGGLFAGVAAAARLPEEGDGVASWLAYINLTLLVFNLLPALPLDGGRVLRSGLWRLRGDFEWASRLAAEAGRATGLLIIAAGVVLFVLGGMLGGAWTAFLGWFVLGAAGGEARRAEARRAIAGLRVRDVMSTDLATAQRDSTLAEFMGSIGHDAKLTSYPVLDEGRIVGLLPTHAVLETPHADWSARSVAEITLGLDKAPLLAPDDDLHTALTRLADAGVNRGLVVDGGRLAGSLSVTDVVRGLEARQDPVARDR